MKVRPDFCRQFYIVAPVLDGALQIGFLYGNDILHGETPLVDIVEEGIFEYVDDVQVIAFDLVGRFGDIQRTLLHSWGALIASMDL